MAKQIRRSIINSTKQSPMEHVIELGSWEPTWRDQIHSCFKPTYQRRKLKNKSAIVVLTHNYIAFSLLFYLSRKLSVHNLKPYYITWGLTLPLLGWLADVRIGRHNLIRWSIWITWIGFMLGTLSSIVSNFVTTDIKIVTKVLLTVASAGFGGHKANVIQYGLDQLQDASTDEITAYISWYVWTSITAGLFIDYTLICIHEEYQILSGGVLCICFTIALIMTFYTNNTLIREPATQNPFKLVYRIIKYAIKNKRPRCRSAFTYCEDELPSRIDFGKSKYGGPFTTEQVEDVKTFFRLLPGLLFYCSLPTIVVIVDQLTYQINKHVNITFQDTPTLECYLNKFYTRTSFFSAAVLIPIYEIGVYPILRRYFSWMKSHFKIFLGIFFQITRVLYLMAFTLKAQHRYVDIYDYNSTIECIFSDNEELSDSFDTRWLVIQNILNSLSLAMLAVGGAEFICAQTPYSMRGLMFGSAYGGIAVYTLIAYCLNQPFITQSSRWGNGKIISCEFWFLCLNTVILGINTVFLLVIGLLYKKRKREDVLPNEQIFAERVYSKQL